jgi:hypothetical protein
MIGSASRLARKWDDLGRFLVESCARLVLPEHFIDLAITLHGRWGCHPGSHRRRPLANPDRSLIVSVKMGGPRIIRWKIDGSFTAETMPLGRLAEYLKELVTLLGETGNCTS